MQPLDAEQLRGAFPFEKRKPVVPNLASVDWSVLEYFGWIHPAGHRGYLVMPLANGELRGLVLRRSQTTSRRRRYEMCSWCNYVHRTNGTAMFSALVQGTDGRLTIGNSMCRNLDCSLRIRHLCGDVPGYMGETIDLDSKIQRLQTAVYQFLYRADALSEPDSSAVFDPSQ